MANSRKKIIFIVTQSEWGGAQEYVFNLAANLDKGRFAVLVLAGEGNGELFDRLQEKSVPWQKLKFTKRAINPVYDLLSLLELLKILKKEQPDVIHLNSSKIGFLGSLAGINSKLKTQNSKVKIIYTAHGWVFEEPLPWLTKKLYLWIEKISARWKDVIITVSDFDRQVALENKFKTKIISIHNAVNLQGFELLEKKSARQELAKRIADSADRFNQHPAARERLGAGFKINDSLMIIGAIANFYPTKGLTYLIEAANILKDKLPDSKFIIIGDGQERQKLEEQIQKNGLQEKVLLTGTVPDAHLYLKAFDIFVVPSVKEGLPYVLLKAMATGIPIVATKVGGIPEVLDNHYLVEPKNAKSLAQKIAETLTDLQRTPSLKLNHHQPNFAEFLNKTAGLY